MTTSPTPLLTLLDQPGDLSIDCTSIPRLSTAVVVKASRRRDPVRLTGASPDLRWTLHLLGLATRFSVEATAMLPLRSLPFQVTIEESGTVVVAVDRAIAHSKLLSDPAAHSWIRALDVPRLAVDFAAVDLVNSVLVAWLLQLAQASKPAAVEIRNARSLIVTQFKQLRLDQMMEIN